MARRKHWLIACIITIALLAPALQASAQFTMNDYFANTWERTDKPVADGNVSRTWMWGPGPYTEPLVEPYAEGIFGEREVQYFDKSRMEITDPNADPNSIWYVTNGLLVVEMTSGEMQVGHDQWIPRWPAEVNVAGDADDFWGPTYETISWNIEDGHTYQDGQLITGVIDLLGYDPDASDAMYGTLAAYGVTAGPYSPDTGKHTASVFWEFMSSNALVYQNDGLVNAPLFENPYYATGFPIDQAWWAEVKVGGTYKWVLVQCFQRRCLTYTPDNPAGWQVEAGNVGQHYYSWRYEGSAAPDTMTEIEYVETIWSIDEDYLDSRYYVFEVLPNSEMSDEEWANAFIAEMTFWRELADEVFNLNPPDNYVLVHWDIMDAYDYIVTASYELQEWVETGNESLLDQGLDTWETGDLMLEEAIEALLEIAPQLTEAEYVDLIWAIDDEFFATIDYIDYLWEIRDLDDPAWVDDFVLELEYLADMYWWLLQVSAPSGYAVLHTDLIDVYTELSIGADLLIEGVLTQSGGSQLLGWITIDDATADLGEIMATFPPGF